MLLDFRSDDAIRKDKVSVENSDQGWVDLYTNIGNEFSQPWSFKYYKELITYEYTYFQKVGTQDFYASKLYVEFEFLLHGW